MNDFKQPLLDGSDGFAFDDFLHFFQVERLVLDKSVRKLHATISSEEDRRADAETHFMQFILLLPKQFTGTFLTFDYEPLDFRFYELAHLRADCTVIVLMVDGPYFVREAPLLSTNQSCPENCRGKQTLTLTIADAVLVALRMSLEAPLDTFSDPYTNTSLDFRVKSANFNTH